MADQLTPRAVFAQVLNYDPLRFDAVPTGQLSHLHSYLRANGTAWRCDDREPRLDESFGQTVAVLLGEAGCGKTTQLDITAERLSQADGNLVVRVDFTHAISLMGEIRHSQAEARLASFLRDCAETTAREHQLWVKYSAARIRFILATKGHAAIARIRHHVDYDGLRDEELLGNEIVSSGIAEYDSQAPDDFISIQAVQLLAGMRTVFLVDNIDKLSSWLVHFTMAKMSAVVRNTTMAVFALRNEHERATDVLFHARPHRVVRMHSNDAAYIAIAKTRANGAFMYLAEFLPSASAESIVRRDAVLSALSTVEQDPALFGLATRWLNGNIRLTLRLIADLAIRLRQQGGAPSSLNGLIFSALVKESAPSGLLEIFKAKRVYAGKYRDLPFVFLPLRVLAYLQEEGGETLVAKMTADFGNHFGLDDNILQKALRILSDDRSSHAMVRTTADGAGRSKVVLLPCGAAFIEQVVYSCDYLALVYDVSSDVRPIEFAGKPSEVKLQKAVEVAGSVLLPAFIREHPYIDPSRDISRSERVRLSSYEVLFNYGRDRWFIERLRESLVNYAQARDLQMPELNRLDGRIQAAARRLNQLSDPTVR